MTDTQEKPDDSQNVDKNITKAVIGIIIALIIIVTIFLYYYNQRSVTIIIKPVTAAITKPITPTPPIVVPVVPTSPPAQTNTITTTGTY